MPEYLRFIILVIAGWINSDQQRIIDYRMEEIRVCREHFEGRRLGFTDEQRRRSGVKARALGRKTLEQFAGIVTANTLFHWYKSHVVKKCDGPAKIEPEKRILNDHGIEPAPERKEKTSWNPFLEAHWSI